VVRYNSDVVVTYSRSPASLSLSLVTVNLLGDFLVEFFDEIIYNFIIVAVVYHQLNKVKSRIPVSVDDMILIAGFPIYRASLAKLSIKIEVFHAK
jgi:hypothetical protein